MNIAVLHGQNHKGSTYHITQMFLDQFKENDTHIAEFYFTDNSSCVGCFNCIMKGVEKCPHYVQNHDIIVSLEQADFIIIESPCYCMGVTGQLKIFLDHFAYRWMSHRPYRDMFSKVGLCICTAAGRGSRKVTKDLKQNMFYWGVPSIFRYSINIGASSWDEVSDSKRQKIQLEVQTKSKQIKHQIEHTHVPIKLKFVFWFMRFIQKNNNWNITDKNHWEAQGWLDHKRPWKQS